MLIKIQSDKFISNGEIRPPIMFHKGLNVIEGQDNGKNSIGKSTLLMCIDFAFGGKDYIEKLKTIKKNVGDHVINFAFEFEDGIHYFSRSTETPKIVNRCNEDFEVINHMSDENFKELLKIKYKIHNQSVTFRELTSRFFRIYNRGNIDETLPLKGFSNETPTNSVEALFKVFNMYEEVKKAKDVSSLSTSKKTTFKSAGDYAFIPAITKTQYDKNVEEIENLEKQLRDLISKTDAGLSTLDGEKSEMIAKIDSQIKSIKRDRSLQYNRMNAIDKDHEFSKVSLESDFEELQKFFPDTKIQKINEIESFHNKLSKIFKKEIEDLKTKIWSSINIYNEQLDDLEKQKKDIGFTTKLPTLLLEQHSAICRKLDKLRKENEYYDQSQDLISTAKKDKAQLEATTLSEGEKLSEIINDKMKTLSNELFTGYNEPKLTITDTGNYSFETENDEGTGTNYKGLILFDLAVFSLTDVPAIAHDSVTVKNIDKDVTEKIYNLYDTFEKQVFVVIDRTNTFDEKMQKIVNDRRVIFLSSDGNELFGRSWAKKVVKSEEEND